MKEENKLPLRKTLRTKFSKYFSERGFELEKTGCNTSYFGATFTNNKNGCFVDFEWTSQHTFVIRVGSYSNLKPLGDDWIYDKLKVTYTSPEVLHYNKSLTSVLTKEINRWVVQKHLRSRHKVL